ncbi:MAG: hypothetical protein EP344_08720 [Bacteroidetes bacterium]|nr:MAG: hypothetical protein EP344_08720 [Bacteroidota bacterium]
MNPINLFNRFKSCNVYTFQVRRLSGLIIALLLLLFPGPSGAQQCFSVNTNNSKVILSAPPLSTLPADQGTLSIPCNKTLANLSVVIAFQPGTEQYFEDSTTFTATLDYEKLTVTTYVLIYNKQTNTFALPANQSGLRDGTYRINISAGNCTPANNPCSDCSITYTFKVEYNNNSTIFVAIESNPDPPVLTCVLANTVTLIGTAPPHSGFNSQWSVLDTSGFVDIVGATNDTFSTAQAGTYRYMLTGPAGCNSSNIISVEPPFFPKLTINPDTQVLNACVQKLTGLTVTNDGGANNIIFNWQASNNGILISGTNSASPIVGAPGTYTVIIRRLDNSCRDTATVEAVAGDIPVVHTEIVTFPDTTRLDCRLTLISLQAVADQTPDPSLFNYKWSNGTNGPVTDITEPGMYSVTATASTSGCQGASSILITQDISLPAIQLTSLRDTVCVGETITLNALTQEPCTYLWDDNSSNSTNNVVPPSNGSNQFSVTVTAQDNGCTGTATRLIERVEPPDLYCLPGDITLETGQQTSLDCSTTGYLIQWIATSTNVRNIPPSGTGLFDNQVYTLANNQAPGMVSYAVYGKNSGCTSAREDIRITVLPDSETGIFIPELITPNGDGTNDQWNIILPDEAADPNTYKLQLFNRNGSQVFSGSLADTFNAGSYPDGTYYYLIAVPGGKTIRGAVTILRRQ